MRGRAIAPRRPARDDEATAGILLAVDRDEVVVPYALRVVGASTAVAAYTTDSELPAAPRPALLSAADRSAVVGATRHDQPGGGVPADR